VRQLHPVLARRERRPRHPDRAALRGILGGTGDYQKIDLEGRWYTPLGRLGGGDQFGGGVQFTLGLTAKSGFIIGDPGPFYTELYSMGGVQFGIPLRGYEEFGITPAGFDASAGGSQARPESFGKAYAAFTVEAGARISQALYANIFTDAGNVYRRMREYNPSRLFRSVGFGVAIISPLGPIGLDVGYGLDKTDLLGKPKPGWQLHFRLGNFF
jgi:outer membrane protein insertion porin family